MNIGIFSDTYFPQLNGVATSIRTLAKGLEKQGHNVYIFTPWDPKSSHIEEPNVFRIPSMAFPFAKSFRAGYLCPPSLLKKIKHLNLDIIHTQTEFSVGFFGKFISATHGVPLIHTYHTMYEDYVHYIGGGHFFTAEMARDYSKMFCNVTTDVIVPTKKTEDLLLQYGVTTPIFVIPTGIDTSHFQKDQYDPAETLRLRESLGISADTPVVLSLGRIAKEKSIDVVMRAMPKLIEKLPTAKMVLVGEGPEVVNLQALAKSLQIENHVVFTGGKPWDEIGKYYQLGDVFCSASVSETQGLTFAEAMAAGVPVVAKKDPCIENIITHNETGLMFENEDELPELLFDVLSSQELSDRLSSNAIAAMQDLSVENFISRVSELYEKIINSDEKPRKIHATVVPLVVGAKAVKGITKIPKKIVNRSLSRSQQLFALLTKLGEKK